MKLKKFIPGTAVLAGLMITFFAGGVSADAAYYTPASEDNYYTETWDLTQYNSRNESSLPENTIDVGSYHINDAFTNGKGAEWNGIWCSDQYRRFVAYTPAVDGVLMVTPMYGDISVTTVLDGNPNVDLSKDHKTDLGNNLTYSAVAVEAGETYYIKAGLYQGVWWGVAKVEFRHATTPAESVTVDPDEGETKDAAGFTYNGKGIDGMTISDITWNVSNGPGSDPAQVKGNIPTITGGGTFTIGLLIKEVPEESIDSLSATVTIE